MGVGGGVVLLSIKSDLYSTFVIYGGHMATL